MKRRLLLIGLSLAACSAMAQQPIQSATADELVDKLAPPKALTRSLRNLAPEPRKIDLMIQFDFNSARLQETSKPLLASLAEAMGSERIKTLRFKVEGHTDAVGKASYNQQLSEKRAQSVLEFLSNKGVEKDRLTAEGKGASELLLPDKPDAMANRRVRITTLN
jgi:outer membrane protein OmpA-like peptidoglycan-associated protein